MSEAGAPRSAVSGPVASEHRAFIPVGSAEYRVKDVSHNFPLAPLPSAKRQTATGKRWKPGDPTSRIGHVFNVCEHDTYQESDPLQTTAGMLNRELL